MYEFYFRFFENTGLNTLSDKEDSPLIAERDMAKKGATCHYLLRIILVWIYACHSVDNETRLLEEDMQRMSQRQQASRPQNGKQEFSTSEYDLEKQVCFSPSKLFAFTPWCTWITMGSKASATQVRPLITSNACLSTIDLVPSWSPPKRNSKESNDRLLTLVDLGPIITLAAEFAWRKFSPSSNSLTKKAFCELTLAGNGLNRFLIWLHSCVAPF